MFKTNINFVDEVIYECTRKEMEDNYERHLCVMSPLPWCDWFQLDLEHMYTTLHMVRGAIRKAHVHLMHEQSE